MGARSLIRHNLLFLLCILLVVGCATTGSYVEDSQESGASTSDSAEIDQLLGQDGSDTGESINEDDVLRLLGVSDDSRSESAMAPSEESATEAGPVTEFSGGESASAQGSDAGQNEKASSPSKATSSADRAAPAWKSDSYTERYQEALQAYRGRKFQDAIQKFEALLATDSKNNLADNCQYWIGEAYYDMTNYNQAILAFGKVFTFGNSNKDDSAQLKIGMCYLKMNDKTKAKEEFQKLVNDYPSSEYTGIAKRFIAQLEEGSPSQ
jgi:tol-pal system protein YbgF